MEGLNGAARDPFAQFPDRERRVRAAFAMPHERGVVRLPFSLPAKKRIRVAAYIRVSTADLSQQSSLRAQRAFFTKMILGNPNYIFRGIFSDDGISGYKADRPALLRLLDEARAGRLDLVYVKSLSRFARNTELLLTVLREFRALRVGVIFDEQNIDTRTASGELMISLLSAVAKAERDTISGNVRWGIAKRIEQGMTQKGTSAPFGYRKTKDGLMPDENAPVVRTIFERYLRGGTFIQIARQLNQQGIRSPQDGQWTQSTIGVILSHEKYKGDCLYMKQRRLENGKRVYNRGQFTSYYVKNNHLPIVDAETWERVQRLKAERVQAGRFPYTGRLKCGRCGASLTRVVVKQRVFWCCGNALRNGKKACPGIRVPEDALPDADDGTILTLTEISGANEQTHPRDQLIAHVHGREKRFAICQTAKKCLR